METHTNTSWVHLRVTYGSRLYGTSTPTSDTDNKVIYVPSLDSLLLGQRIKIFKEREDKDGNRLPDDIPMPDSGVETEHIPIQTFVRDFVAGQTYALEIAFAYLSFGPPKHGPLYTSEKPVYDFVKEMVDRFANSRVYSMVSFATKQTLDYVNRGERMTFIYSVLTVLKKMERDWIAHKKSGDMRLDSEFEGSPALDTIASLTQLKIGSVENNGKMNRSLELNGRSYLETTTVKHLIMLLEKVLKTYGERTIEAATSNVEWKSLSHAVRVYQQAIELLDTGIITFPRANAAYLLSIKQGKEDNARVKELLKNLDAEVIAKIESSTMRKHTPELVAEAEQFLLEKLHDLYSISLLNDD